ncbi:putative scopoletin glucosyltransferase [Dioscorea sansibarensis]
MEECTKAPSSLRVFFFPLMSHGHMIPLNDVAKPFAVRGVSTTTIVTPGNEPFARPTITRANSTISNTLPSINLLLLPFPFPSSVLHLLPSSKQNLISLPFSSSPDFFSAIFTLEQPFSDLLGAHLPDCLMSDSMFPWTSDAAMKLGIPRIVFHGPGIFSLCVHNSLELHNNFRDDGNSFIVQDIPDIIKMKRHEIRTIFEASTVLKMVSDAEKRSYGVIVNSFYELEPAYAELYL